MRTGRIRNLLYTGLATLLLAGLWHFFAPAAVGGSASYVVTDGISMQPRFHTGDLAIVRSEPSYHVGEIVAYHNHALHTVVLHRIVAMAGGRYTFKGDNNNFLDFEHPARSQLIGALWVHLPGWGKRLKSLHSPWLMGALIAAGVLLLGGAAFANRRRRRGRRRREGSWQGSPLRAQHASASPRLLAILAAGVLALLPFMALALAAYTTPASSRQPTKLAYRQSGSLSYSAQATPGPAYAGNRAETGQPLFTHVISSVALRYAYRFSSAAQHALSGRGRLLAEVTSTSGWQTQLPLGPAKLFRGQSATITGRLDLDALMALLHSVEHSTAISGTYTLTIVPQVSIGGSLGGIPLRTSFTQGNIFTLEKLEIRPASSSGANLTSSQALNLFEHSTSGSANGRSWQPSVLSLPLHRSIQVTVARAIAAGALLLVVICTAVALIALRPRRRSQAEEIKARYGPAIVPVARVWLQPGVPVIDVEDMEALARIAAHYERSILAEQTEYGEAFWVTDESGQFRYVAAEAEPEWAESTPQPIEAEPFAAESPAAEPFTVGPVAADPSEAPTATHWLPAEGFGGRQAPAY